jgi:hypothetical protein
MFFQKLQALLLRFLDLLGSKYSALVLILAQLKHMHFIRTIHNTHSSAVGVHLSKRCILGHTGTTIGLNSAVDDVEQCLGNEDLCDCDFLEGGFGISVVDCDGGIQNDETSRVDLDAGPGNTLEHDTVLREKFAEGLLALVVDTSEEVVECLLCGTDAAHGVVNTSWSEAALDDLESLSWSKNDMVEGYADVVEGDVGVSMGSIVESEYGKHAVDGDAWGGGWDEDDGLLEMLVGVAGVALAHDNVDLAAWITSA